MRFPSLAAQVAGCQRVLHSVFDKMRPALSELKTQFFVFTQHATQFPAQHATKFPAQHATKFPTQHATKFPTQVIGGESKPFTRIVQECTPAKVARQCRVYEFHKQAKLTYETRLLYCDFRLKLRAARLLQMRFATKSRFQQLQNLKIRSLLKIRNTIDINMSPRMLTSDKKFCARSILRAAYQQKLSQDPCVPFSLYNILCADNLQ